MSKIVWIEVHGTTVPGNRDEIRLGLGKFKESWSIGIGFNLGIFVTASMDKIGVGGIREVLQWPRTKELVFGIQSHS